MSIYAIGDLHLSFGTNKPMDIFGDEWLNHEDKLQKNWNNIIKEEDTVLILGDFSWETYLENTINDFTFLNKLKGKKVLLKGNHDYWWTTVKKMNDFLAKNNIYNVEFLHNNSIEIENTIIVGTRGWMYNDIENDEKILKRELLRLELSIKNAKQKNKNKELICIMHYPPITKTMIVNSKKSEFLELMKKYGIKKCFYGHLHGKAFEEAVEGNVEGIELKLVSSDYLKFIPLKII